MFRIGDKVRIKKVAADALCNPDLANLRGSVVHAEPIVESHCFQYECDGTLGESGLFLTEVELEYDND